MIAWNIHMKPVLAWKVFHYGETSSFLVPPDLWPGGMYPTPGTLKNLYRASKDQWFYLKDLVPQSCSSVKVKTAKTLLKCPNETFLLYPPHLWEGGMYSPPLAVGIPIRAPKRIFTLQPWNGDLTLHFFVSTFLHFSSAWNLEDSRSPKTVFIHKIISFSLAAFDRHYCFFTLLDSG